MSGASDTKPMMILDTWKAAWRHVAFRVETVATFVLLVIVLGLFSRFLEWVELRNGASISDPIIATIAARDFTWPIFLLIYGGLILGLATLAAHPVRLIAAVQSYILMVLIRFVVMYVTPFDPPPGIIPLADPFVQFFGSGSVPTKDLFFSGHTATLLLLSFAARRNGLKLSFALCAFIVAVLIVWQHVHYTVDVLVAPFVAYASYRSVVFFQQHILGNEIQSENRNSI